MIKKPFFSMGAPRLKYPVVKRPDPGFDSIPLPERVTVYIKRPFSPALEGLIKAGERVKTGSRLFFDDEGSCFLSPVTGTIAALDAHTGYMGIRCTSVTIETVAEEEVHEDIKALSGTLSSENAALFLVDLPGSPDFKSFMERKEPYEAIVVEGVDDDLLVRVNQAVLEGELKDVLEGIQILKRLTGVEQVYITALPYSSLKMKSGDVTVIEVSDLYPSALPEMVMKNKLKRVVPAGNRCSDSGFGFIKAEAVASLARLINKGEAPVYKAVTVIDKKGSARNLRVRIGTRVCDILTHLGISTSHGERIIAGGPMRGKSIYSEDMPVLWDTDAIMVQAGREITPCQDTPCINCGECVRACPANIPVNMLIRLLENRLYEMAVSEYDLLSCIECGLCAYVCVARIPLFQYIMLGKNEYLKLKSEEGSNV
ncbi:MAG: 4Fe-4S dicluster domain-containing protein [Deltaproteobacteria bacterium]|nr:4Fe-4S dicluster domain-containing protein [Deltaproteobacteria bacterium]